MAEALIRGYFTTAIEPRRLCREDPTTGRIVPLRVEMVNVAEFPPFLTLGIEVKLTKSRKILEGREREE